MPVTISRNGLGSIRDILKEQTRILGAIHSKLSPVRDAVAEVYRAEVFLDDTKYVDDERVLVFLVSYREEAQVPENIVVSIPITMIDGCDVDALVLWVREHATTYQSMVA